VAGVELFIDNPSTELGTTLLLMIDPEGNEFCICEGGLPS
jgi:hypothetical protein